MKDGPLASFIGKIEDQDSKTPKSLKFESEFKRRLAAGGTFVHGAGSPV
jgi:hypothetical protein